MARANPLGKAQGGLEDYYAQLQRERAGLVERLQEIESKIDTVGRALEVLASGDTNDKANGKPNDTLISREMKPEHLRSKSAPKKARQRGVGQKVTAMLTARGKATAAEITKTLGMNSGSVQYALRTLEEKGTIRQTGKMVGRTREYEIVGTGRIAEPGSADTA